MQQIEYIGKQYGFEYILLHHLKVFSESYAAGACNYDEMVKMYEQYVMSEMSTSERSTLRTYKKIMNDLREILYRRYDEEISRFSKMTDEFAEKLRERDSVLSAFERIYSDYLLRWTVACTRKEFKAGSSDVYGISEFFEDLKIELQLFFDEETVEEVFQKHGRPKVKEGSRINQRQVE